METIIFLCGIYSIAFAIFHICFWKLFNWKKELGKLNYANKAIMQILNIRIIFLLFFVAFICFYFPKELLHTLFGQVFLAGISLFWLGRTIEQFIFFRINNKFVHILTLLFIMGAVLFGVPVLIVMGNR